MRLESPLDAVFASQGHVRVLRALDGLPQGLAVSVRDLARRAGLRHPRTSEILADLRLQGLALVQRAGRADLYRLNSKHLLYPTLHRLFREEDTTQAELVRTLRTGLARARRHIKEAYLFGSVARAESDSSSDIDLAVVAPEPDGAIVSATLDALTRVVKQRFGNDLSIHVSRDPVERRQRSRDPGRDLWRRVAREGVPIIPEEGAPRA